MTKTLLFVLTGHGDPVALDVRSGGVGCGDELGARSSGTEISDRPNTKE